MTESRKEFINSLDGEDIKYNLTSSKEIVKIHVIVEPEMISEQTLGKIEMVAGVKTHNIKRALKYGIISLKLKNKDIINELNQLSEVKSIEVENKQQSE